MTTIQKLLATDNPGTIEKAVAVIDYIRPVSRSETAIGDAQERLSEMNRFLSENEEIRLHWSAFIIKTLGRYNPGYLYRERSFFGNTNLFAKFWKLLRLKILPKAIPDNEMDKLLDLLFKRKRDYKWVNKLDPETWAHLLELLELKSLFEKNEAVTKKLMQSIIHISYRIAALGMDSDILNKIPILNDQNSPFLRQNKEIMQLLDKCQLISPQEHKQLSRIHEQLDLCRNYVLALRENKRILGISMHLTYISKRLLQQIDRIQLLLDILAQKDSRQFYLDLTRLFREILEYQEVKNSITKLMRESVNLVAFEIVEHTAQKGEKYIAGTRKEYWSFLTKSMLGGLIIAFFASFKIQMGKWDVSPLGEGLLFGLNYSICFVLVYVLGGIIATKQPAMTASSIVQAIDKDTGDSIDSIKNMIIRVSRSQFISFLGNLSLAFPMAMLIAWSFPTVTNDLLLNAAKSEYLLKDIHPLQSGAFYYAAIAGVILSLSGLISGYFDNKVVYDNVRERIIRHPALAKWVPGKALEKLANYLYKNSGALAGNISLGMLLGLTGAFGFFTGLPLDIRHVAFSSANLGFAMEYEAFSLEPSMLIWVIIGVLGIGLINFLVSFGLTFWIAMRSRDASFELFRQLFLALLKHLVTRPHHFFLPVAIR